MAIEPADVEIDGSVVRELRKLKGLTQGALAERAEISQQYLSFIERKDRKVVSPPVFVRLCDALGIHDRRQLIRQTERSAA